ncbi:MAG: argininosuccinate lyase [Holophagaceae bacterium]|nr:argininosuccinate lyase [Holophagaceae bacterium]
MPADTIGGGQERPKGAQLWAKGAPLDAAVHAFTVGEDFLTDLALVPFDCTGSAAHARMLAGAGLLDPTDAAALVAALKELQGEALAGRFAIAPEQEDGHTAIEAALVAKLGDAGKRIHLGRSRNDQVLLALRLLMRERLLALAAQTAGLAAAFLAFGQAHAQEALPGYTHLRRAMPSTFGQWAGAYAEGLLESLGDARALYAKLDRCPLGAAAGFGVPLPIDRERTAELLGFDSVQRNPVDVMNSRGRHELALLQWLGGIAFTLEKFLWDVALYSTEEFAFLDVPPAFTTGSSIMPQKRNPDVVELARATCGQLRGAAHIVEQIATGLPSSYHRDFQLLKKPLLGALQDAAAWLGVLQALVPALQIKAEAAAEACTDELYAAHAACQLVKEGWTFRDAYREVAAELAAGAFEPDRAALSATHTGGTANLGLAAAEAELAAHRAWIDGKQAFLRGKLEALWETT